MTAGLKYTLLAVVFLLGYTSMSFELLVLRQLINFVGSNTLITSVVITFILLFLSVGYYIGSVVRFAGSSNRRGSRMRYIPGRPVRRIMESLAMILVVWYIIACSYYLIEIYFIFCMPRECVRHLVLFLLSRLHFSLSRQYAWGL